MKKLFIALAVFFAAAALTSMEKSKIKDGTYEGTGKGRNAAVIVETTFKNNKIVNVKVVKHSETPSFWQKASSVLLPKIVRENRVDLDVVAGASGSSRGILEAVKKSIMEAGGDVEDFQLIGPFFC